MLNGELKRRAAAERVAHHIHLFQAELLEHNAEVAADVDEIDLPRTERRAAVTVQMHTDHPPMLSQFRQHRAEQFGREESTVQQQEWLALAPRLEPIVDAVGVDVAARI